MQGLGNVMQMHTIQPNIQLDLAFHPFPVTKKVAKQKSFKEYSVINEEYIIHSALSEG